MRPRYSFLNHLASAIWLNHDPSRCWMAVLTKFTAYYDASGSQGDKGGAVLVVGMVSTEKKWARLEGEWLEVLRDFRAPYFHMKEFVHGAGPFKPWRDDYDKRASFLKDLMRVAKRGVNKSFGHGVFLADYRLLNQHYRFSEKFGGAYCFSAGACLASIKKWMRGKYSHARIAHIFEKGDSGQGELRRLVPLYELTAITVKEKVDPNTGEWFVPFQVADLIAWEFRRAITDVDKDMGIPLRESLRTMLRTLPTSGGVQGARHLQAFAESRGVPRRS